MKLNKTIYLDWNVFQDIFQNRKDSRLEENINAAKNKGFITPYSYGHISDLSRCSNDIYLKNDLENIVKISSKKYININNDHSQIEVANVDPEVILENLRRINSEIPEKENVSFYFQSYKVDVNRINSDNLVIKYLPKYGGYMCPELISEMISDIQEKGLSDHVFQREFRNSFIEAIKIGDPAFKRLIDTPFFKYLFSDKFSITENLPEILNYFLRITGKNIDELNKFEKFQTAYGILDFFPVFKEKIDKRNNMNNMLTDAIHVYNASYCSYFICGDNNLLEKANVIYKNFNIKTKIYNTERFISNVEF